MGIGAMFEQEDFQVLARREEADQFIAAVAAEANDTDTGVHD